MFKKMLMSPNKDSDGDVGNNDEALDETETETGIETNAEADADVAEDESHEDVDEDEESIEDLRRSVAQLRKALRKANREAASRRLKLKEIGQGQNQNQDTGQAKEDEQETLKTELAKAKEENRRLKLAKRVRGAASNLKVEFFNDEAAEDAIERVLRELDDDDDDDDAIKEELKDLVKVRPYLFRKSVERRETDSQRRSAGEFKVSEEEEREIAARFGIT